MSFYSEYIYYSIFMYLDIEIMFNFLLLKINPEIDFIILFIDTVDLLWYL